jgi:hypothetical protein
MTETSTGSGTVDDLPPFAALVTDEEREKKAELSSPGTYNVVVNQDSFQHLPEYTDDPEIKRERLSPLRRGSIAHSLASSHGRDIAIEGVPVPGDPNIVLLPRFEDVARRATFSSMKDPRSPIFASGRDGIIKSEDTDEVFFTEEPAPMTDGEGIGPDGRYLQQFRKTVWKQLVPAEQGLDESMHSCVNVLEAEAMNFPPVCISKMCWSLLTESSYTMP